MAAKLLYISDDKYYIVAADSVVPERNNKCTALIMGILNLRHEISIEIYQPFKSESGLEYRIYDCPKDLEKRFTTELERVRLNSLSPELRPYAINGLIV